MVFPKHSGQNPLPCTYRNTTPTHKPTIVNTNRWLRGGPRTRQPNMKHLSGLKLTLLSMLTVFALSGGGLATVTAWQDSLTVGDVTIKSGVGHQAGPSPWEQKISQIATRTGQTVAIDTTGQAWAWGEDDSYDSLPFPNYKNRYYPEKFFENHTATNIWQGYENGFIRDNEGQLWAWGNNKNHIISPTNQTSIRTPIKMVEPATFTQIDQSYPTSDGCTTLAIDTQGDLWAWGYEKQFNQLFADGPGPEKTIPKPQKTVTGKNFKQLAVADDTAFALDNNGALWAWGSNNVGMLATGKAVFEEAWATPRIITPDKHYKQISAKGGHILALDTDNNLWGWGSSLNGELTGNNDSYPTPKRISLPTGVEITKIATNRDTSIVLDTNDHAWAWGSNNFGRLGVGGTQPNYRTPTPIAGNHLFTQIAAGNAHAVAIDTDGHAWAWGDNIHGSSGAGKNIDTLKQPVRVQTYNPTPTW